MKLKVGIASFGYANFRHDIGQTYLDETLEKLKKTDVELIYNDKIIVDEKIAREQLQYFKDQNVDLLVFQLGTLTGGSIMMDAIEILRETPLFVWGFKDPIVDDYNTIPLNTLTSLNMFTSFLKKVDKKFTYAYGSNDDNSCFEKLEKTIEALEVKKSLKSSTFAVIGSRVPGFYLSAVDEIMFRDKIGPRVIYHSIGELLRQADKVSSEIVDVEVEKIYENTIVTTTKEMLQKMVRIEIAIREFVEANDVTALSIKCWPEFQQQYGCGVCGVVSRLTDSGILTSCEGDISGLVTMYIQHKLTGEIPFFTDLVTITEKGALKAWHCGNGPISLAKEGEKAKYIEHPTIKCGMGTSVNYTMKLGKVTMNKLTEDIKSNSYKLFMACGDSIEVDRELEGTQTDIKFDRPFDEILDVIVENGIEHHYSIIHKNIQGQLKELCKWMDIKIIQG